MVDVCRTIDVWCCRRRMPLCDGHLSACTTHAQRFAGDQQIVLGFLLVRPLPYDFTSCLKLGTNRDGYLFNFLLKVNQNKIWERQLSINDAALLFIWNYYFKAHISNNQFAHTWRERAHYVFDYVNYLMRFNIILTTAIINVFRVECLLSAVNVR